MPTLRRRFLLATSVLVTIQGASALAALKSWQQVVASTDQEQALASYRAEVTALSEGARELYVHQAHTFIEGGPSHLDHYHEVGIAVSRQLTHVEGLPLPDVTRATLADTRVFLDESDRFFLAKVVPEARSGTLDRAKSATLHLRAEELADAVGVRTGALLRTLDEEAATERGRAADATARAWAATALLTLGSVLASVVVARRLANAVLGPLRSLRSAAHALGDGDAKARAPIHGDEELVDLGTTFNAMAEKLAAAEERRVQAERLAALGEMSAAVAHELLNPLTVILGHPDVPAAVHAEADHARRIVRGLIGFARPGEEPAAVVDLGALAREAVDRVGVTADCGDVRLELRAGPVRATASPSAVRQVLDNLLRNAVEAAPPGTIVEVEVAEGPCVRVLDRGPGLPTEVKARLYEPFVTGRPVGTGLGLAISQRIARAQGGAILHADRPGGGTVATWNLGSAHA